MGRSKVDGLEEDVDTGDFLLYFGLACGMLLLSMITYYVTKMTRSTKQEGQRQRPIEGRGQVNRGQAAVRNRGRRQVVRDDSDSDDNAGAQIGRAPVARDSDGSDRDVELDERLNDPKLGAKKRAKLEAKAEKRANREAEERMRDDRKTRQLKEENERKLREQKEAEAEKRREEEEKRLREEKAQKELEEYNEFKAAMSIEGEGCEVIEEEEEGNLIEKFINHIQSKKVILFEELATQFGLKVPDTIDRLKTLVEEGRLTGVMDDRGKFIYISEEELNKFAKFIKQRGRVSISDLVENSASLITLEPDAATI